MGVAVLVMTLSVYSIICCQQHLTRAWCRSSILQQSCGALISMPYRIAYCSGPRTLALTTGGADVDGCRIESLQLVKHVFLLNKRPKLQTAAAYKTYTHQMSASLHA